MEDDQELRRFVCKSCNKRYPCGKSLGGHMRSHHVIANSDEKLEPNVRKICKEDSRVELGGHFASASASAAGYGLRENPKRTWRASDSNFPLHQERVCKQCGKGFQSLKALCGHMACHSEKERVLKDDHSWTSENQKLLMDSHSDTDAEAPRRGAKRSSSVRYKRVAVKSSYLLNGSSSVFEIDHEQEEVAMCLMMLSRDSGNWVGVNFVAESSDNNSVVLETKSSSIDMRIGRKKGLNWVHNRDETAKIKKLQKGKLKSGVFDAEEATQFENSDSEYFINGPKKVDSDVSVDGFLTNDNFKKHKIEGGSNSRFMVSDTELGKGLNKVKCKRTESTNNLFPKEKGHDESGIVSNSIKFDSRKRTVIGSYSKKKQSVRDLLCNGERRLKSKKSKGHECPICHRMFKSGQALGGHKRSHFLGESREKSNQTIPVIEQEISEVPDLLDLNLPALPEEEENEFMSW
ncbi:hypothetical protein ACSBR1_040411 [Camellia fascicularis]